MMRTRHLRRVSVTVCFLLLLSHAPRTAQDLSETYRPLALAPEDVGSLAEPPWWCGNTFDLLREAQTGIRTAGPLADGWGVRADQTPRWLRPTHAGEFGFNNFTVLGDHATVTFERFDPWADNEDRITTETWQRVRTSSVAGRTVSVFTPRWPAKELQDYLRRIRWGIDQPILFWGRLVLPGTGTEAAFGQIAAEDEEKVGVVINMLPPGLPATPVTKIDDTVQYSSHVVNMWIPEFGNSRVSGGDDDLDLEVITAKFYQHFRDEYEVSQAHS